MGAMPPKVGVIVFLVVLLCVLAWACNRGSDGGMIGPQPGNPKCGNGVVEGSEQCDNGNTDSCDGCSATCGTESGLTCGDGILNQACGEQCDDGNTGSGDGCSSTCMTEGLADCTIDFDGSCPVQSRQCGALFTGGRGCLIAGLPFCYDTGSFAFEVRLANPLTIDLSDDLLRLDVFFATGGTDQGQMLFFDAQGMQVDGPLMTNGDCSATMPPTQGLVFSRPVRSIMVEALGASPVYVDTFHVNP